MRRRSVAELVHQLDDRRIERRRGMGDTVEAERHRLIDAAEPPIDHAFHPIEGFILFENFIHHGFDPLDRAGIAVVIFRFAAGGKIIAGTPMGRFGNPEELIGAALFLASDEASGFVNGIVLPVDGGYSAYSGV